MSGVKFEPLRSLARHAKQRRMEMQCDPSWVLDVFAERDALRAEVEALRRDAARYERLRRLNPRQFADLFERNLKGERFDDLIDQMEAAPGSWQAGYDKGRADGVKFRLSELEQERRIAAELHAVALRLIKTYVTDDAHDDRRALERLSRMRQEVSQ